MSVRNGRLIHRSRFYCVDDLAGWKGFLELLAGLLGGMGITGDFHWEIWNVEAATRIVIN